MNQEEITNKPSNNGKMKEFVAHSKNNFGEIHLLKDHLKNTAVRAHSFATDEDLTNLFYLAGILHDVGKYQDGFQNYIEYGGQKTFHAGIGAYIAKILFNKLIPLQFAIQGHHAGLPDNENRRSNNENYAQSEELAQELITRLYNDLAEIKNKEADLPQLYSKNLLLTECLTRLLFSSLTDADWLDTERHFLPEKSQARLESEIDYDELINQLEKIFTLLPIDREINRLRTEARLDVINKFSKPPGFFSIQLPTGLGKTLTSIHWALLHAKENKLKRIIIVLPYINIIDQTATILKEIFGEEIILEHHSGIMEGDDEYSNETFDSTQLSPKQLACENWQAPIIITTAVQFFESLFSNRPSKCRKNHNIANSVVIFDEVQTLPKELVEPTIIMLKNISQVSKTSFLFCTATMPAFGKREGFDGIEETISLIGNPMKYFDVTKRVEYKLIKKLKPVGLDIVAEQLLKEKTSYLAVVNTKSVAKKLFVKIKEGRTHDEYFHLSTAMCAHHRKKIIKKIIAALSAKPKRKIAVVSTQLVEAGVDFDFPCVYRAIAPLDSVIQAAGRCNRNGKMKKGKVVLFDLTDHPMPDKTYRACAEFAKGIIKDDPQILHHAESFERYYEQVIEFFVDPDRYKITKEREMFNFKTVNNQYHIIDKQTTLLFAAFYSNESKELFEEVTKFFDNSGFISKELYRKIQQFGVQVYPNFLKKYGSQIEQHKSGLRIWLGKYDQEFGIAPEDVETVF
ncbi:MAG: CRISPR-associated helicase Cas3' [Bacteroidetes bacterium]|nr:CRISPR-associated helicase Cas3' [Bacteroidota bacterium]